MNKPVVLFCLFSFFSLTVFSQQYNFVNYTVEDGLVQSQVRDICQDTNGYIWLSTLGGVSKFDGTSFKNLSLNDGLLDINTYTILKSSDNRIFIGSKGGINVIDHKGALNSFLFKNSLAQYYVHALAEGKDKSLWIGVENWVVKFKDQKFYYYRIDKGHIYNIFCDANNNAWVSTAKGIAVIKDNLLITDTITSSRVSQVLIENNTIWYSTYGRGLVRISGNDTLQLQKKDGLISNNIRGFLKRKDNTMWLYSSQGIVILSNNTIYPLTTKQGLQNENIRCLMEDTEGNVFIGTDGSGLIKYTGEQFISYTKQDGLSSDIAMSITEKENGSIWFTSYQGEVTKYTSNQIINYSSSDGIQNPFLYCSHKLKDGTILFGGKNGITAYDGKEFFPYFKDVNNRIWSIYEDESYNLWVGTWNSLLFFDKEKDTIVRHKIGENVKDILAITPDSLWFSTDDGVYVYSPSNKNFTSYTTTNGLPNNFTMSLVKDKNDVAWVGTVNGLAYFMNNAFHPVNFTDIPSAKFITFLKVDDRNNLWIGTNYGLFEFSIDAYENLTPKDFNHFTDKDGLRSVECNQNSAFIDTKNNLWFGTSKGIMKHNLGSIKRNHLPKVHLTAVKLFFEKDNLLDRTAFSSTNPDSSQLNLNYRQNHLTFYYSGINHSNPSKVLFQFKLEGNDEDWLPPTSNTFFNYSNLQPNDYSFYLRASIDGRVWTSPKRFNFTITPPFWSTWWFYLLVIAITSGIIWEVIRRRKKKELLKKETQRIVDRSKMLVLEHQALNASMNRHFIFNALTSIQYFINRQDKLSANNYLSSFAKLVRKNLDSSMEHEILLEEEVNRIQLYLELEQMRFKDKFTFNINIDKNIDLQKIKIPPMLLQPFVENSILHGILPNNKKGHIGIELNQQNNQLIIKIIDDGIGVEKSLKQKREKKSKTPQLHVSQGMKLTKGRIELISKISNKECQIIGPEETHDEQGNSTGTMVTLILSF